MKELLTHHFPPPHVTLSTHHPPTPLSRAHRGIGMKQVKSGRQREGGTGYLTRDKTYSCPSPFSLTHITIFYGCNSFTHCLTSQFITADHQMVVFTDDDWLWNSPLHLQMMPG